MKVTQKTSILFLSFFSMMAFGIVAKSNFERVIEIGLERWLSSPESNAENYLYDSLEGKNLDSQEFRNLFLWDIEDGITHASSYDVRLSFVKSENRRGYVLPESRRKEILGLASNVKFIESMCSVARPKFLSQLEEMHQHIQSAFPEYDPEGKLSLKEVLVSSVYTQLEVISKDLDEAYTLTSPENSHPKGFRFFKRRLKEGGRELLDSYRMCLQSLSNDLQGWSSLSIQNWEQRMDQVSNR